MKLVATLIASLFAVSAFDRHLLPRKKKPSQPRLHQHLLPSQLRKRPSLSKATLRKTTKKPTLLRSNPAPTIVLTLDDSEYEIEGSESLHVGYRRPELIHNPVDVELSDYVKFRLWLARQLALRKYERTWE